MAVDRAMNEMKQDFKTLFTSLQILKCIVSREDLLMFDKDLKTVRRWARHHDSQRVDGPDRSKIYYDIEDIKKKVRRSQAS